MDVTFSSEELAVLRRIVEGHLVDLRTEIVRTDNFEARRDLKAEEVVVKSLIERLAHLDRALAVEV